MKTYELLAADLVQTLGYDAMDEEIRSGEQTAMRTFEWLRNIKAYSTMDARVQMIVDTALVALRQEEGK